MHVIQMYHFHRSLTVDVGFTYLFDDKHEEPLNKVSPHRTTAFLKDHKKKHIPKNSN